MIFIADFRHNFVQFLMIFMAQYSLLRNRYILSLGSLSKCFTELNDQASTTNRCHSIEHFVHASQSAIVLLILLSTARKTRREMRFY